MFQLSNGEWHRARIDAEDTRRRTQTCVNNQYHVEGADLNNSNNCSIKMHWYCIRWHAYHPCSSSSTPLRRQSTVAGNNGAFWQLIRCSNTRVHKFSEHTQETDSGFRLIKSSEWRDFPFTWSKMTTVQGLTYFELNSLIGIYQARPDETRLSHHP